MPSYEQKSFGELMWPGQWLLVRRPMRSAARCASIRISRLYRAQLEAGQKLTHEIPAERHAWLQVLGGSVRVGGAARGR